jgi:hypothetical protein
MCIPDYIGKFLLFFLNFNESDEENAITSGKKNGFMNYKINDYGDIMLDCSRITEAYIVHGY